MPLAAVLGQRGRRERKGLDLKWVLVRRIILVAILCMTGGALLVLRDIANEAAQQNEEAAATVAKQLSLQLTRIDAALDRPDRFPDWEVVVNYALHPGQCIQFVRPGRKETHSSCLGTDAQAGIAPSWFVEAYEGYPGQPTVEIPLIYKGDVAGVVRATMEASTVADRAWMELSRLLGIAATMILAMCILVYVVVQSALRPTADILSGLSLLAEGNLLHRLPRFKLRELDRIAEVFNDLAQKLEGSTRDRSELARKLVNSQEQERRHIARELHDDVAQRLSVVNSLANSIKKACQQAAPSISAQSEELVAMTSGTMRSLRETLSHLRPPEIDDLGLVPSLQVLVAEHNRRADGQTCFELNTEGRFDDLPAETAAHVYRIIQEGLTNAARHANAPSVRVSMVSSLDQQNMRHVELAVTDNGDAMTPAAPDNGRPGVGLVGIRERVYALSGSFAAQRLPTGGFELRVSFPVRKDLQEEAA